VNQLSPSPFNVLDPNLNLNQNMVLEASAGTGKTFSIQHLVVRYILQEKIPIDRILLVTFTNASTRELRVRVGTAIGDALTGLKRGECSVPYLEPYLDEENRLLAIRLLEEAWFQFESAQIFTLHKFCSRMLKEYFLSGDTPVSKEERIFTREEMRIIVRDLFRDQICEPEFSSAQISILLKSFRDDSDAMIEAVVKLIEKNGKIIPKGNFIDEKRICAQYISELKIDEEKVIDDFLLLAPGYQKVADRAGVVKEEILAAVRAMAKAIENGDLDELLRVGIPFATLLSEPKKRSPTIDFSKLHYPRLKEELENNLLPHFKILTDPSAILSHIASKGQHACLRVIEEKDRFRPDDLLTKMANRLNHPIFQQEIRSRYDVAVIDEFQDTDPLQWKIFQTLFLDETYEGRLILVGDPKQSIYSFRSADVYTYLAATEAIHSEGHFTLNRNYRSAPALVSGLNHLFSRAPDLFPLPARDQPLPFHPVESDSSRTTTSFNDDRQRIHFFVSESPKGRSKRWPTDEMENHFIDWIGHEILSLGIPYQSIAILVKDRFQANKVVERLKTVRIPALMRRMRLLTELDAYEALKDVLHAILKPFDQSALKRALLGKICGWGFDHLQQIELAEQRGEIQAIEESIALFIHIQNIWRSKGIASAMQSLFDSTLPTMKKSIGEEIMSRTDGDRLYDHLLQLIDLLCEREVEDLFTPEALILHYKELTSGKYEDDPNLRLTQDQESDSVTVITTHTSKGLEFDVVFAIGVSGRNQSNEEMIPAKQNGEKVLVVRDVGSAAEQEFLNELDSEKGRQLYVALTRAKSRLYIPFLIQTDQKSPIGPGISSPLELWASSANIFHPKDLPSEFISWSSIEEMSDHLIARPIAQPPLNPPKQVPITFSPLWLQSYTSLTRNLMHAETIGAPSDYYSLNRTIHTIPAGRELGIILHSILEEGKFQRWVDQKQGEAFLRIKLAGGKFSGWEEPLAEMLRYAVITKLPGVDFALVDVDPIRMIYETEFILPAKRAPQIEGISYRDGYIHGIIDLLFEKGGRVYLIDWKTNWLGPDCSYYTKDNLERAMNDHLYNIQAQIYSAAANQYLQKIGKGTIAAIYYLFMRGGIIRYESTN